MRRFLLAAFAFLLVASAAHAGLFPMGSLMPGGGGGAAAGSPPPAVLAAALPACNAAAEGSTRVVTDSNTSASGATIAGGGANRVTGMCLLNAWRVVGAGAAADSPSTTATTYVIDSDNGAAAPANGSGWKVEGGTGADIGCLYDAGLASMACSGGDGWSFTATYGASVQGDGLTLIDDAPLLYLADSETDNGVGPSIEANCTAGTADSENCDVSFKTFSVAMGTPGVAQSMMTFDADGGIGGVPMVNFPYTVRFNHNVRMPVNDVSDPSSEAGRFTYSSANRQFRIGTGSDTVVFDGYETYCTKIPSAAPGDDNIPLVTFPRATDLLAVGCNCQGTCAPTLATFAIKDHAGNAISPAGALTCSTNGVATFQSVTADTGNHDKLAAGASVVLDTTNNPTDGGNYTLCVQYARDDAIL